MLQQKPVYVSSLPGYEVTLNRTTKSEDALGGEDKDESLDDTARTEREYVRKRLSEELKREPTEQEVDEWLRQHTEGY